MYTVAKLFFALLLSVTATLIEDEVSLLQVRQSTKSASASYATHMLKNSISQLAIAVRKSIPHGDSLDVHALAADARDLLLREAGEMPYGKVADFMANFATYAPDSVLVAPLQDADEDQKIKPVGRHVQATEMTQADAPDGSAFPIVPPNKDLDLNALAADARSLLLAEAKDMAYPELGELIANFANQAPDSTILAPFLNDGKAAQKKRPEYPKQNAKMAAEMPEAKSVAMESEAPQKPDFSMPTAGDARDLLYREAEEMPFDEVAQLIATFATTAGDEKLLEPFKNGPPPMGQPSAPPSDQVEQTTKFGQAMDATPNAVQDDHGLKRAMAGIAHELDGLGKLVGGDTAQDILGKIFNTAIKQSDLQLPEKIDTKMKKQVGNAEMQVVDAVKDAKKAKKKVDGDIASKSTEKEADEESKKEDQAADDLHKSLEGLLENYAEDDSQETSQDQQDFQEGSDVGQQLAENVLGKKDEAHDDSQEMSQDQQDFQEGWDVGQQLADKILGNLFKDDPPADSIKDDVK